MATENELKFILDLQFAQDLKDGKIKSTDEDRFFHNPDPIKQAYLYGDVGLSVRIRGVYRTIPHFSMTVKQKLESRVGVVEVEAEIPEREEEPCGIQIPEQSEVPR